MINDMAGTGAMVPAGAGAGVQALEFGDGLMTTRDPALVIAGRSAMLLIREARADLREKQNYNYQVGADQTELQRWTGRRPFKFSAYWDF